LSLLLFNFALEPFLLSILHEQQLKGYKSPSTPVTDSEPNLKCLAYADDVCVLSQDHNDLYCLQIHIQQYGAVSNVKFNEHKSEAFSLSGNKDISWVTRLLDLNISTYYHKSSTEEFRYLGYYLPYSSNQHCHLEENLVATVKNQCGMYSQRQISIRGRVTVMNILILTKLWYTLHRLFPQIISLTDKLIPNFKNRL
jgi:hypothetical protein